MQKKWLIVNLAASFLALVLSCAALFVALTSAGTSAPAAQTSAAEPYSLEWFRTASAPDPSQPYVSITCSSNPVYAVEDAIYLDGLGWSYSLTLTETNGKTFHVDSLTQYTFNAAGQAFPQAFTAEQVASWWNGSNAIPGSESRSFSAGMPVQDVTYQGISVLGHSEDGAFLEFHYLVEFNPELRK